MSPELPDAPSNKAAPINPETARIVLQLDDAISAFRAGKPTGLRALDGASQLDGAATNDAVTHDGERRAFSRIVPRRPDHIELAVLTALANTYGSEMLTNSSLGYVLRLVARYGGVALVQRVLLGESAADSQLSVMLTATRVAFAQISIRLADAFFADANDVIAGFRSRPQGKSASRTSGHD